VQDPGRFVTGQQPVQQPVQQPGNSTGSCLSNVGGFVSANLSDARALASELPNGATAQEVLATAGNETHYGDMRTLAQFGNLFGLHGTGFPGQLPGPNNTYTTPYNVLTPKFPLSNGFRLSGQIFVNTERPYLAKVNASDPQTFFQTIHLHGYGTTTPGYVNFMTKNKPGDRGPYALIGACLAGVK
jgi:hypothetical protein